VPLPVEGRVKQLTANINRKDGLLKDTKQVMEVSLTDM